MAKSAYIHIPFCSHKCDFCDFAAFAGVDQLSNEYCTIVAEEIQQRLQLQTNGEILETVFFGGGTPGYVEPPLLAIILKALQKETGIAADAEITLETTPQTISAEKCKQWLSMGINRISIGIESMHDNELKAMGRDHTRAEAIKGFETARAAGFENIALDLMYGLPEQTLDSWARTLDDLHALKPEHLSSYGLTIATNSPLLFRYPRDSEKYPDEENFEQMYLMLVDKCNTAGMPQYEIANFAIPGRESKHNMCYWRNQEYLAFGVSAHRYYRGTRSSNFRSLKKYMREFLESENVETIDEQTRAKEAIFLGLRLRKGINVADFSEKYGLDILQTKKEKIEELCQSGFLSLEGHQLSLTQRGILVSNTILAELI
jgi:oxygen-independent coproporphyrinogen-3 oxidase